MPARCGLFPERFGDGARNIQIQFSPRFAGATDDKESMTANPHILLVEDDAEISKLLTLSLIHI